MHKTSNLLWMLRVQTEESSTMFWPMDYGREDVWGRSSHPKFLRWMMHECGAYILVLHGVWWSFLFLVFCLVCLHDIAEAFLAITWLLSASDQASSKWTYLLFFSVTMADVAAQQGQLESVLSLTPEEGNNDIKQGESWVKDFVCPCVIDKLWSRYEQFCLFHFRISAEHHTRFLSHPDTWSYSWKGIQEPHSCLCPRWK